MDQKNQKQLKFNGKNMLTGLFLLMILNTLVPLFLNPLTDEGRMFYFFGALMTAFLFPFVEVKDVERQDKTPES